MLFDKLSYEVTTLNRAKAVGRQARKRNYARKTDQELMSVYGYTLEQAKAYLEAYDAAISDNQEKLEINKAKHAGRQARKGNFTRKTEEQLMRDNGYTLEQAKAYLEAYDAVIPDNQEKLKINKAKYAGRKACKRNTARKTEEQLMRDNGYTQVQAKAYLEAYYAFIPDNQEKLEINNAKYAGRQARKANCARKTEKQLMRDNRYTPEQAKAYLEAYDAVIVDEEQAQIRKAKLAGRQARITHCARKSEEQLMSDNYYTLEQAKAYLEAFDGGIPANEEMKNLYLAKDAGRHASKRNTPRKTEEQLMSDNGYTLEQAKAYLQVYDATVATKAEKAQIKDANLLKRKGENSPEVLAKRHAKNVSAQGDSESPLSTNTASSQCELPPENSIDILIDAIFEQEKEQNMCFHYSAISRRNTLSSVDESLVNADAKNALSKVR